MSTHRQGAALEGFGGEESGAHELVHLGHSVQIAHFNSSTLLALAVSTEHGSISKNGTSGTCFSEHKELNQDEQWRPSGSSPCSFGRRQERYLDQLRMNAPPLVELYPIHTSLSSRGAHLPWIPCSFLIPPKRSPFSQSSPVRRQAQGAVVARTMAPPELPQLSSNALSGCCKVCKGPEEEEKRFLICGHSLCMYKYYHIQCLTSKQILSEQQLGNPCWYCPSCLCRVCYCDMDDNEIILCDGCDEGYHLYCLNPPRTSVPKGKWHCASCTEKRAKEGEMRKYEKKMLKLHRNDAGAPMVSCANLYGVNLLLSAAKDLGDDEPTIAE